MSENNNNKSFAKKFKSYFTKDVIISTITSCTIVFVLSFTKIGQLPMKRYILNNSDDIAASFERKQEQEMKKQQENAYKNIGVVKQKLLESSTTIILGNTESENVVVEFFDYSCSYCKQTAMELKALLDKGADFKLILASVPLLSQESLYASRAAEYVAANSPEKFASFHFALMSSATNKDSILREIKKVGLSVSQAESIMLAQEQGEYDLILQENFNLFQAVKGRGAPLFIINDEIIESALTANQIEAKLGL